MSQQATVTVSDRLARDCVTSRRVGRQRPMASQTRSAGLEFYAEMVLDLDSIDVEEIATALADQTDYEHRWLFDPRTGEVVFWTSDTGIDGENPVELEELDLILIEPLPSYIWYQDMVDFAEGISDRAAGRSLSASLQGKGAFRRFKKRGVRTPPRADLGLAGHAGCQGPSAGGPVAGGRGTRRRRRR